MQSIIQKTKVYYGKDSLSVLSEKKNSRIFIVTDKFLSEGGMIKEVLKYISPDNEVYIFDDVFPDPSLELVGRALKKLIDFKADCLIGFGGGSPIDTSKGINYFKKSMGEGTVKFYAIPTTSGSGSEITSVTVLTDTKERIKHLLASDDLMPDVAILDPKLTETLPKTIVAHTGLDVLTHSVEAYVAKNSTDFTDALSEKSGELVVNNLLRMYLNISDDISREKMLVASNLAGMAFNKAGLGINHSIAHQLGGQFHIPHGLANAILMNSVIKFNCKNKDVEKKYAKYAYKIGVVNHSEDVEGAVSELRNYIRNLMNLLEIPSKISEYGVDKEIWNQRKKEIAENAVKDNCTKTNPISIDKNDVISILDEIY